MTLILKCRRYNVEEFLKHVEQHRCRCFLIKKCKVNRATFRAHCFHGEGPGVFGGGADFFFITGTARQREPRAELGSSLSSILLTNHTMCGVLFIRWCTTVPPPPSRQLVFQVASLLGAAAEESDLFPKLLRSALSRALIFARFIFVLFSSCVWRRRRRTRGSPGFFVHSSCV